MRRRLLLLVLGLLTGVITALAVPLATAHAGRVSLDAYVTQLRDTNRFATLAEAALRDDRTDVLAFELERHGELYGTETLVVDEERRSVAPRGASLAPDDPLVRLALDDALSGRASEPPHVVWPWDRRPFVVAEPAGVDGHVVGAVVTVDSTAPVRQAVATRLLLLTIGSLAALALGGLVLAVPLVRWILRPVAQLAATAQEISDGRLGARVPESSGAPELRRLARAFNAMADSVERALDRQRFFVAQASHQLRNPLTALRLRVELLEAHVVATGRDEHRTAMVELERLSGLLENLLRLAATDVDRPERRPVDVATVAAERVTAWRPEYEHSGTPLQARLPVEDPPRLLPLGVVDQILDELLHNAVKFAPGRPVRLSVRARGDEVALAVSDRGPGLAGEDLRHLGERFWRSRRHQNVAGTGLGLAIVAALAEACGGRLRAGPSGVGGGLTVTVVLPAADAGAAWPGQPTTDEVSGAPAGTSRPLRDEGPADTSTPPSGPSDDARRGVLVRASPNP